MYTRARIQSWEFFKKGLKDVLLVAPASLITQFSDAESE